MFIRVGINEHNNKIEKKKVKQGTKKEWLNKMKNLGLQQRLIMNNKIMTKRGINSQQIRTNK